MITNFGSGLSLCVIIIIIVCFVCGSSLCGPTNVYTISPFTNEKNERDFCTNLEDVNSCLGYGGDFCVYCKNRGYNRCLPKTYDRIRNCGDVMKSDEYYSFYHPYYIPYIYDIYNSTKDMFDWNDWYRYNDYFPPFVYKPNRYYLNTNDRRISNKYAYLAHNGVASIDANSLIRKRGKLYRNEIRSNYNKFRNLGFLGHQILSSLNNKKSFPYLANLGKNYGFPFRKENRYGNNVMIDKKMNSVLN